MGDLATPVRNAADDALQDSFTVVLASIRDFFVMAEAAGRDREARQEPIAR